MSEPEKGAGTFFERLRERHEREMRYEGPQCIDFLSWQWWVFLLVTSFAMSIYTSLPEDAPFWLSILSAMGVWFSIAIYGGSRVRVAWRIGQQQVQDRLSKERDQNRGTR